VTPPASPSATRSRNSNSPVGPSGDAENGATVENGSAVENGGTVVVPEPVEEKSTLAVPQHKKDKDKESSRADLYKYLN
jgi:hypothetical protein